MKQTISLFLFFLNIFFSLAQNKISNTPQNDSLVKQFGLSISKSIHIQNSNFFLKKLNSDAFYYKIILEDKSNKALTKFNKKFKDAYKKRIVSFPQEMSDAVKNGDFYNFVSYHFDEKDKTYHLIFRYYTTNYGLDYHDYRLLQHTKDIYIDDIFVFSSNQKLSETLKLYYLSSVPKKILNPLFKNSDFKYILMLKNFVDARSANQYQKAQQHLTILHKKLHKKDRLIAFLRLENARHISEESYFEAMDDILNNFYTDPTIQLTTKQYHYANKDYDEVEKCINSLKNYTNDPFLDFEKGNLFFAKKDYESAAIFYENMLQNFPTFHLPKFSLLVVYNHLQQFKKATKLLDVIVQTTTYTKTQLIAQVQKKLIAFSKSKEFKLWVKN